MKEPGRDTETARNKGRHWESYKGTESWREREMGIQRTRDGERE